jgi:DNA polymerase V
MGVRKTVLINSRTSPFRKQDPEYSRSASIHLPSPTSDSAHITQAANAIVKRIYRPGFKYAMTLPPKNVLLS